VKKQTQSEYFINIVIKSVKLDFKRLILDSKSKTGNTILCLQKKTLHNKKADEKIMLQSISKEDLSHT